MSLIKSILLNKEGDYTNVTSTKDNLIHIHILKIVFSQNIFSFQYLFLNALVGDLGNIFEKMSFLARFYIIFKNAHL